MNVISRRILRTSLALTAATGLGAFLWQEGKAGNQQLEDAFQKWKSEAVANHNYSVFKGFNGGIDTLYRVNENDMKEGGSFYKYFGVHKEGKSDLLREIDYQKDYLLKERRITEGPDGVSYHLREDEVKFVARTPNVYHYHGE